MEVALRNSPRDVDKAGGHGQSHNPKIPLDTKIPLEPNLFWKSNLGPAGATRDENHWEGGGVAGGSSGKHVGRSVDGGVRPVARPRPGSGPRPGHQVVEDEEDEDEGHGHGQEKPAVVTAGARHAREALHAARQQPCHAQEIRVLVGKDTLEALQNYGTSRVSQGNILSPKGITGRSQSSSKPCMGHPNNSSADLGLLP